MNNIMVDKRVFLQAKKRSTTKSRLPEIKNPLAFNVNGSSLFKKISDDLVMK